MKSQTPYRGISLSGLITLVSCFLVLAKVRAGGTAKTAIQWYTSSLQNRPLITKSTTAAVVMTVSDLLCQKLEISMQNSRCESNPVDLNLPAKAHPVDDDRRNPTSGTRTGRFTHRLFSRHDWYRTRDVAITGLTWSGPASHTWYAILEAVVTVKHRFFGVVVRLALDATIFSPIAGKYSVDSRRLVPVCYACDTSKLSQAFVPQLLTLFDSGRLFYMENLVGRQRCRRCSRQVESQMEGCSCC